MTTTTRRWCRSCPRARAYSRHIANPIRAKAPAPPHIGALPVQVTCSRKLNALRAPSARMAYNLNCWLMLFNREPQTDATQLHRPWRPPDCASCSWPPRSGATPVALWRKLQRSLRGEGRVRTVDGSAAPDRAARAGLCARDGAGPPLIGPACSSIAMHRDLCTACKRNGARGFGGVGLSREGDEPAATELTYSLTSAPTDRDRRSAGWFCA